MRTVCDCCDYEIEEVRAALKVFFESCGISEEGLHRENWVEGNQACAEMDRERRKRGEASLVAVLGKGSVEIYRDVGIWGMGAGIWDMGLESGGPGI